MIMAGRGRRLDVGAQAGSLGTLGVAPVDGTADLSTLIDKINQINLNDVNSALLMTIHDFFNKLCSSKETMTDVLSNLHDKALKEAEFGEKLVVALEQVSNLEVNGVSLRGELLTLIQKDFEVKDKLCESDPKTFINAVVLLGRVYNRIKVCGAPIAVLGIAMVEYFDLLLKGQEEELKTLTKQILINGNTLEEVPAYEQFKVKLRDGLINSSSNSLTKCWLLLLIDLISNDFKLLKEPVREFYISNLKDEYVKLESLMSDRSSALNSSPQSLKSSESISPKSQFPRKSSHKTDNSKKNLTKKFSDLSVRTDGPGFKGKKDWGQTSPGKNFKRDNWRQNPGREGTMSEHDDRFEKDENFYGVQRPRQPKLPKEKSSKTEFNETKTSPVKPKDDKDKSIGEECWKP